MNITVNFWCTCIYSSGGKLSLKGTWAIHRDTTVYFHIQLLEPEYKITAEIQHMSKLDLIPL